MDILLRIKEEIDEHFRFFGKEPTLIFVSRDDYVFLASSFSYYSAGVSILRVYGIEVKSNAYVHKGTVVGIQSLEQERLFGGKGSIVKLECECGAHKAGSPAHSHWCPINPGPKKLKVPEEYK